MTDDNGVIISRSNSTAELFTVLGFKIFLSCDKDIRRRVKLQELSRPLLGQMIWHNKQRFIAKPQSFGLHSSRHHFKGFACSDCVCKERITAVKNVSNRIFLMFPEFNFRVHSVENNVAAVILTRTNTVKFLIIVLAKSFPSFRVRPYPILKFLLNYFLFRLGNRCFLFIKDSLFLTLDIFNIIKDTHIL